jgi:hypothetical protein
MSAVFLALAAVVTTATLLLGLGVVFIQVGATGAIVGGVLVIVAVLLGGIAVARRPRGLQSRS